MFFVFVVSSDSFNRLSHLSSFVNNFFIFFCFAFVIFSITFKRQLVYFITFNNLLSRTFFKFFLCIFHFALSISRQGCPACSVLHLLFQRRRLSYHHRFKLSTFFLFFIYFAQFRQFNSFTNTVYKISFFYFHVQQTYYYQKLFLFTIRKKPFFVRLYLFDILPTTKGFSSI